MQRARLAGAYWFTSHVSTLLGGQKKLGDLWSKLRQRHLSKEEFKATIHNFGLAAASEEDSDVAQFGLYVKGLAEKTAGFSCSALSYCLRVGEKMRLLCDGQNTAAGPWRQNFILATVLKRLMMASMTNGLHLLMINDGSFKQRGMKMFCRVFNVQPVCLFQLAAKKAAKDDQQLQQLVGLPVIPCTALIGKKKG